MKCLTDSAIELTWPGVPVTACASIRPCGSKTPAERSPASRTIGENAVRSSTCACSSTTAISRFHMIWRCDIAAVLGLHSCACAALSRQDQRAAGIDDSPSNRAEHERRRALLGDDRRAREPAARRQSHPAHICARRTACPSAGIEHLTLADR